MQEAIAKSIEICDLLGVRIDLVFNDIRIPVYPGSYVEKLVADYHQDYAAHYASPKEKP